MELAALHHGQTEKHSVESKVPCRRRSPRGSLSPEQKWEIWLEVTSGELTQADAARKWGVDVATVIKLRKDAKNACLTRPGFRVRSKRGC